MDEDGLYPWQITPMICASKPGITKVDRKKHARNRNSRMVNGDDTGYKKPAIRDDKGRKIGFRK